MLSCAINGKMQDNNKKVKKAVKIFFIFSLTFYSILLYYNDFDLIIRKNQLF